MFGRCTSAMILRVWGQVQGTRHWGISCAGLVRGQEAASRPTVLSAPTRTPLAFPWAGSSVCGCKQRCQHLLEGTPSIRRGNNQTWVSVCPHEFPSVLTLNQIQLAFLTASMVTYSDFRLNIRSRGSSFAVLSSTSFHTCVILNNPCNKSFILYHSKSFCFSGQTPTESGRTRSQDPCRQCIQHPAPWIWNQQSTWTAFCSGPWALRAPGMFYLFSSWHTFLFFPFSYSPSLTTPAPRPHLLSLLLTAPFLLSQSSAPFWLPVSLLHSTPPRTTWTTFFPAASGLLRKIIQMWK